MRGGRSAPGTRPRKRESKPRRSRVVRPTPQRPSSAPAPSAALVANYCDHAEHNESVAREWVVGAGERMRRLAVEVAAAVKLDIFELYANRLTAIEGAHVARAAHSFDGGAAVRAASTWRELQLVQLEHDSAYHLDVLGLARADQLRHYAFHLAKLAGAFGRAVRREAADAEIVERRLPDILLFGIKLATVMGERLTGDPLGRQPAGAAG
jgi:hypothetical protein